MFNTLTVVELMACATAGDLTGLKQVRERVAVLAMRSAGWAPLVQLAEGHLHLLCESYPAALAAFERGLELARDPAVQSDRISVSYCPLVAGQIEAMIGLGRNHDARAAGENALALCRRLEIGVSGYGIARAVALAEAKTGAYDDAVARLDGVIAGQLELGISGLHLGASYEARARVAIYAAEEQAVAHYAALTAREYRHGRNSPLGARYERLMHEARLADKANPPSASLDTRVPESTSGSAALSIDESSELLDITVHLEHD